MPSEESLKLAQEWWLRFWGGIEIHKLDDEGCRSIAALLDKVREERGAEVERLRDALELHFKTIKNLEAAYEAKVERLMAALRDCAQIANDATHACVTVEEEEIAITIRNLILSRYPESRKALKGEEE